MIKEVIVYMGDEKITTEDMKNYICINDYVSELVNEVYYKIYPEKKPKNNLRKNQ